MAGYLDVHQHLWPETFLAALRARREPPFLDFWTLHLEGQAPGAITPEDHDPKLRVALLGADDSAILSHSSPLGVEDLPARDSDYLLAAYHEGVAGLDDRFGWWGAISRATVEAGDVAVRRAMESLVDAGTAGLQVPATWLDGPDRVSALAPAIAVLQEADLPLFVHPGPAGASSGPPWWTPVVDYVAQMSAAWWAWHVWCADARGRPAGLRICFAAGAGLAPLHHERLRARGGGGMVVDPCTYVDLSGYAHQAFDALLRVLGIDGLVAGSDRPYATALEIPTDPAAHHAIRRANPHRLMTGGSP